MGSCLGTPINCDDGDPTTIDSCNPTSGCVHTPTTTTYTPRSCDDGNACTQGEYYNQNRNCVGGTPVNCNDGNSQTIDTCIPATGCVNFYKDAIPPEFQCEDGNPCTVGDYRIGGVCTSGLPRDCNDGDPSTIDSCDVRGGCKHIPITTTTTTYTPRPCDDGNACTRGEYYDRLGNCVNGTPVICNDDNTLTDDSCNPISGCIFKPRGETTIKGDADDDGQITSRDVLAALWVSVGKIPFNANLDMDSNGKVDSDDARIILKNSVIGSSRSRG